MNEIPLNSYPERFRIQLNNRLIELRTAYFLTNNTWKLDIYENDQCLVAGVSLLNGVDILRPYNLGLGSMGLVDITTKHLDADSVTLGNRVLLVHMTTEEYNSLLAVGLESFAIPMAAMNKRKAPYVYDISEN
jgi:hypothetical protein